MPVAVLVSPAPIDGYPPVQHQARLLADQGYVVELLTSALPWQSPAIAFTHPGVTVHVVQHRRGKAFGAYGRLWDYVIKLAKLRRKHRKDQIFEIAYEPIGALYSDLALYRPSTRVVHFHETLQGLESLWIDQRLRSAIHGFSLAIVADTDRGAILQDQLSIDASRVLVVPNYPALKIVQPVPRKADEPFTVVYCGSLGLEQKLDLIIRSVKDWPQRTRFCIMGQSETPIGALLQRLAQEEGVGDRVIFEGWVAYDQVPERLAQADLGISLLDSSFIQWRTALGASNKRYQYMQAGLPQIGDMNPGVKDFLEGQSIGSCVATHDAPEIAALIQAYEGQPERCRLEGERARALHQARYNYQVAFQPVLDWLTDRKGGG